MPNESTAGWVPVGQLSRLPQCIVTSVATASAQNIFEALFGRLWNSPADPNVPLHSPEATRSEAPRSEGGIAYCVRLCDGRYFPLQRHSGVSSAQTCSSFCPASATRIYNGNAIDHAVAPDGKRYSELATAFAYRKKRRLRPRHHTRCR